MMKFRQFLLNERKIGNVDGYNVLISNHVKNHLRNGQHRQGDLPDEILYKMIDKGLEISKWMTSDLTGLYHFRGKWKDKNVGIVLQLENVLKIVTIMIQDKPVFNKKDPGSVFEIGNF